ncbi:hypothetical protein EYV94_27595, partial [Puteibacter caeruleilacunae]
MNKIFLLLIGLLITQVCIAQTNTFPSSGSVGIGTTNPSQKLDVKGNINISGNGTYASLTAGLTSSLYTQQLRFWNDKMGYVWGGGYKVYFSQSNDIWFGDYDRALGTNAAQLDARIGATKYYNGNGIFELFMQTGGQIRFWVDCNGNVGIGTRTPDYLLDVAGIIRAKEIKVNLNDGPDYVFEDDYDLKSLDEVDQFIKDRKHLPGIPSAKQMEKDGVGLA